MAAQKAARSALTCTYFMGFIQAPVPVPVLAQCEYLSIWRMHMLRPGSSSRGERWNAGNWSCRMKSSKMATKMDWPGLDCSLLACSKCRGKRRRCSTCSPVCPTSIPIGWSSQKYKTKKYRYSRRESDRNTGLSPISATDKLYQCVPEETLVLVLLLHKWNLAAIFLLSGTISPLFWRKSLKFCLFFRCFFFFFWDKPHTPVALRKSAK